MTVHVTVKYTLHKNESPGNISELTLNIFASGVACNVHSTILSGHLCKFAFIFAMTSADTHTHTNSSVSTTRARF